MRTLVLMASLLLLVGCTHIEYVDRPVYIYPDRTWTQQVPSTVPPDKKDFALQAPATQLGLLGNYSLAQDKQLGTCNAQLGKIDQWILDHAAEDAKKQ